MSGIKRIIDSVFLGKTGGKAQVDNRKLARILHLLSEASGTNNAVPITYAALKALYDSGTMTVGKYEITDWRSISIIPGTVLRNIDKRGDDIVEHSLIVEAISPSKLSHIAFDMEFPNDIVHYDITGERGGLSYPSDGSGKGWVFFREFYCEDAVFTGTEEVKSTISVNGFDVRNTVVPIYAIDLSSIRGDAISHCSLYASRSLHFTDTMTNVTSVALDLTDYDADTNTDGVKYHFMFQDRRTNYTRVRSFNLNKISNWNNGYNSGGYSIPLIYFHEKSYIANVNITCTMEGQLFVGENCTIVNVNFINKFMSLTLHMRDDVNTWANTTTYWGAYRNKTMISDCNISHFQAMLLSGLIGGKGELTSGYLTISGFGDSSDLPVTPTDAIGYQPVISIFKSTLAYIRNTSNYGWKNTIFDNCSSIVVKTLSSIVDVEYRNIKLWWWEGSNKYIELDPTLHVNDFYDTAGTTQYNTVLNDYKTVKDYAAGAATNIDLRANEGGGNRLNEVAGIVELINCSGGSINVIRGGIQKELTILNNSGNTIALTDTASISNGAIRFKTAGVSTINLTDGSMITLTAIGQYWYI